MHRLEHVMVRDVMIRDFPTVRRTDSLDEIIRLARENTHIGSLPVMNDEGHLVGIIRPGDLRRVLDTDMSPELINAGDIAMIAPIALPANANLLEALRDFGASDVMRRYREEMLRRY